MAQQTAVEWLEEKLAKNLKHIVQNVDSDLMQSLFEQAKQMEKEQIEDAFQSGKWNGFDEDQSEFKDPTEYYKETYK